jgi:hypothetical protein
MTLSFGIAPSNVNDQGSSSARGRKAEPSKTTGSSPLDLAEPAIQSSPPPPRSPSLSQPWRRPAWPTRRRGEPTSSRSPAVFRRRTVWATKALRPRIVVDRGGAARASESWTAEPSVRWSDVSSTTLGPDQGRVTERFAAKWSEGLLPPRSSLVWLGRATSSISDRVASRRPLRSEPLPGTDERRT